MLPCRAALGCAVVRCSALSRRAAPVALAATRRHFSGAVVDDAPPAEAIAGLQEMFRADPGKAQAVFSSTSELTTGLRSAITIRDFPPIMVDEPQGLGGTDTAPNPVEILLGSLGSCQEITYKAYGQAMGIPITRVSVALEGHIDLRGFLAVSKDARPGFHTINGTVTIESTADDAQLEQLKVRLA